MSHGPLIGVLVAGLGLAFVFGALAHRLRLPPLVGYLVAGFAVGPFTPGFVADQKLAADLAEVGIILLMFGVGLHFSLSDLLAVRRIAIPGPMIQMTAATLLGMALATLIGWDPAAAFVFGFALSVASTVVLLRALQERRIVQTERGRIAVGWLIVQDLVMVLALVLIPAIGGALNGKLGHGPLATWFGFGLAGVLTLTFVKVAAFLALILIVGRKVIPAALHWVAHTGSRELFRLSVLAVALGVAFGAANLFGVSFSLGAFFAGMILSESRLSQRAAEETLPLRDAFAVLFFVSVGMLFNPAIVVEAPLELAATVAIVMVGTPLVAFMIVRGFGHPRRTALTIAASLSQIGEFSFILAGLGVALGVLPAEGRDLILAGAIIAILCNPLVFRVAEKFGGREEPAKRPPLPEPEPVPLAPTTLEDHIVVVGYGRVGGYLGAGLREKGEMFLVIEDDEEAAANAANDGAEVLSGNAADPNILGAANLPRARRLFVAIPDAFEAGQVVQQARAANPDLEVVARAHSDDEVAHLTRCGATLTIMGEREIALEMLRFVDAPAGEVLSVDPLRSKPRERAEAGDVDA